jgi:hypothetical protein
MNVEPQPNRSLSRCRCGIGAALASDRLTGTTVVHRPLTRSLKTHLLDNGCCGYILSIRNGFYMRKSACTSGLFSPDRRCSNAQDGRNYSETRGDPRSGVRSREQDAHPTGLLRR